MAGRNPLITLNNGVEIPAPGARRLPEQPGADGRCRTGVRGGPDPEIVDTKRFTFAIPDGRTEEWRDDER